MPPTSRRGTLAGIGCTATSPYEKRRPVKSIGSPDHARRMISTPSSSRLGRLVSDRPKASNSSCAVAHADAEVEAPAGEQRERGGVLGESDRVVQRQQHQVRADPHPGRALGDRGGDHERRGRVAVVDEVVLGEPHRVEAELLGGDDLVERAAVELLERDPPLLGVAEVVPEAERTSSATALIPPVVPGPRPARR